MSDYFTSAARRAVAGATGSARVPAGDEGGWVEPAVEPVAGASTAPSGSTPSPAVRGTEGLRDPVTTAEPPPLTPAPVAGEPVQRWGVAADSPPAPVAPGQRRAWPEGLPKSHEVPEDRVPGVEVPAARTREAADPPGRVVPRPAPLPPAADRGVEPSTSSAPAAESPAPPWPVDRGEALALADAAIWGVPGSPGPQGPAGPPGRPGPVAAAIAPDPDPAPATLPPPLPPDPRAGRAEVEPSGPSLVIDRLDVEIVDDRAPAPPEHSARPRPSGRLAATGRHGSTWGW